MVNYGRYSFLDFLKIFFSLVMTNLFYRPARLVRHPIRLRGKKNILISKGFTCGYYCRIEAFSINNKSPTMIMGENLNIGDFCHIASLDKIEFGSNVLLGSSVFISDHDHGNSEYEDLLKTPSNRSLVSAPIIIGDNVWIGEKASILKGVKIGSNSIIGAGSIVTKDVPPYSVAVGIPAKVIKIINNK